MSWLELNLNVILHSWKEPFSYNELIAELNESIELNEKMYLIDDNRFKYKFDVDTDRTIGELYKDGIDYLNSFLRELMISLRSKHGSEDVLGSFQIPEEFRSSADQYLLYFIQFLKDLGIEATGGIEQDGPHTLLKLVPRDKDVALDDIRKALDIYLKIPEQPDLEIISQEFADPAVKMLEMEVYNLKGKLKLAEMMVATQGERIKLMELQRYEINKPQIPPAAEKSNREDLIEGVLAVDTFKKGGIELNLGELLRRLKRKLPGSNKQLGEGDIKEDE